MQKKQFYSHLVEVESIHVELDTLDLTDEEKKHLQSLIESNLHHTILESILSELSTEDKQYFLEHLLQDNHDKVWEHLNSKVDNIEDKIKKAADDVKEAIKKDIKDTKEKK